MSRPRRQSRQIWRFGVPAVTLMAGLLLSTTHGLAGGSDIRRSDAPRLVDLVRDAQGSVDRLTERRDTLATEVDSFHGRSADAALSAMQTRIAELGEQAGQTAMRGRGLVVTMTDAQRDVDGRFPRDASPDDLVVHQQDISAVLNALWSAGAEAVQMQDQRIIATSAPRCVGSTLLLNGRTYSPPYTISAIGDPAAMRAALAEAPLVTLYRQYVVRFGLGYSEEVREQLEVVAHSEPIRVQYAKPTGPIPY
ncbi:DUF881 domain-containing protein [Mycolicibacterium brumae]|uniref:DUF881 domain-containing protein n=1 Tax=Mycolicibacterium brumae TaxID=85968 RepID=A0A2G5P633_9MYCO|nr:DUF881 domain-containing protein [Mycolicibacterium brumae]MCV7192209.1 DUF881 domain-containing protein [Mycolicibacterium brumae]PIB73570.1 DUF881 domain-containing protein [Mycolicibacterium brumae]RWA21266.1 hypothetical protein MBRU_15085 [Mycolicibacterium brumae DSM 44177]UWW07034.1 DUF881 domain-containing protein [Mycolicibacterium brumae]